MINSNTQNLESGPIIKKHKLWRRLEMVPGLITWGTLLFPIVFSLFVPNLVAAFIIVYTIIWLFRSLKLSFNLLRSYTVTQEAINTDWTKFLNLYDYPEKIEYELKRLNKEADPKTYFQLYNLKNTIANLAQKNDYKKSRQIWHAIILVTYKEKYGLIRESIKSYATSRYPHQKMILVIGGEESDQKNFEIIKEKIIKEFGKSFEKIITTIHPSNIAGEIKGKSANATFAARALQKYLDEKNIAYEDVLISNFDADTVADKFYFSELTYKYLITENRTIKTFQPTHFFHNNIWDVPLLVRMTSLSCTYWRMAESMDSDDYKSFSSRSMSFKLAHATNFWDPAVIPEDSRQFWTAYCLYNGKHELVPIYTPVYMDAVLSDTYVKTFKNQYEQLRRWAYGVCDFPFMALNLWYNPNIPFWTKVSKIYEFLLSGFFWATGPILLMFTGFIPGLLNVNFRDTVLAYNLPKIMSNLLTFSSIGILGCAIISLKLVPNNPNKTWFGRFLLIIQWLFTPIASLFLSAIPALDAQTRLLFGWYLEYRVTEKHRVK